MLARRICVRVRKLDASDKCPLPTTLIVMGVCRVEGSRPTGLHDDREVFAIGTRLSQVVIVNSKECCVGCLSLQAYHGVGFRQLPRATRAQAAISLLPAQLVTTDLLFPALSFPNSLYHTALMALEDDIRAPTKVRFKLEERVRSLIACRAQFYQEDIVQRISAPNQTGIVLVCRPYLDVSGAPTNYWYIH